MSDSCKWQKYEYVHRIPITWHFIFEMIFRRLRHRSYAIKTSFWHTAQKVDTEIIFKDIPPESEVR